jgi:lipopolysaccharide transport system ATP-binding protein
MTTSEFNANTNIAIEATCLSKCYRIYDHPRDRLLQAIWGRDRRGRPKQLFREFWALQEISFSLERGQTLGVMGRNGSGKSTLLQLLCGTLQPTTGHVKMHGRVGALLELGSGFNPEFSGFENVFLNAALLGLSRDETERRLDEILAFAEIGEFIHQPVKTYSSGMAVRLAFAVQAHIDPDVLVVDEALAVGDELFQKKCYSHLERLKEEGTSVLLVTHSSMQIMQHCDKALLLHKGQAKMMGEPAKIVVFYQRLLNAGDEEWATIIDQGNGDNINRVEESGEELGSNRSTGPKQEEHNLNLRATYDPHLKPQSTEVYPSNGGSIEDAWIETASGCKANILPFGEGFTLVFRYKADSGLHNIAMSCFIASQTGQGVSGQTIPPLMGPAKEGNIGSVAPGAEWTARYTFKGGLWPGVYFISGALVAFPIEGKRFIHRVIDFRALRILDIAEATPLGACSLATKPGELEGLRRLDD